MPTPRIPAALLLAASLGGTVARADLDPDAIPFGGRPAGLPFSGASGDFRVYAEAAPTRVQAQDPVTLTLTVAAHGDRPVRRPPQRPDLRELPDVAARFDVVDPEDGGDRRPDPRTWEFIYRLHPKSVGAATVPSLPLVFFNPDIQYPGKGFQTAYTDPIPLEVVPREAYQTPLTGPAFLFEAAPADRLLARETPWAPGPVAVFAALLLPPLLCMAIYIVWRRRNPDAVRRLRQRRSRAAHRALEALSRAQRKLPVAPGVAAAVAGYLRERFDLPAEEPTPAEAEACFKRVGVPAELAERAAAVLRDCDAARFGPAGAADGPDLAKGAEQLVLDVEDALETAAESPHPSPSGIAHEPL
jgi:hypothetical protein